MQTRVSHYLRDLERAGLIGAGTTLHGLRVSYAAWWKLTGGANNSGGGRPAGRQVEAHGQALHPACRGGGERHPSLQSGEGRKVNRFCTILENGSAGLENIRCPGAKTL